MTYVFQNLITLNTVWRANVSQSSVKNIRIESLRIDLHIGEIHYTTNEDLWATVIFITDIWEIENISEQLLSSAKALYKQK